jgi:anti-anti-sigma factor
MEIFRVETTETPGELRLIGELDIAGAETLSRAIAGVDNGNLSLSLDLTRLEFLDSSGLRELLKAAREHPERRIRLLSPSPSVHKVLEIAGVLSAFDVLDGPDTSD